MVTKAELIAALAPLKDDDEVIVAVLTPADDEETGFSETENTASASDKSREDDDNDPGYVEYSVQEIEVVEATDDSGSKALLLYVDIEADDDDDTIYVDDEGHFVDEDDNYVDAEGNPSAVPVKAPPEDADA